MISCIKNWVGLQYLQQRRWIRRLCLFYKFLSTTQPSRIHNLFPQMRNSHRHPNSSMYFLVELNTSKILFLHMLLMNGIKLIQTFVALVIIKFIRPIERKIFNINDPFGIKILTRLRLGFTHLRE